MRAKGINRLEIRCLVRRIQAENDAEQRGKQKCTDYKSHTWKNGELLDIRQVHILLELTGEHESAERRRGEAAENNADNAAAAADNRRLDEKLPDNIALACADCHADADFARALGDGYEHDVHNADAADEKRNAGDAAAEQRHEVARGFLLLLGLAVGVGAEIAAVRLAAPLHEVGKRLLGERLNILAVRGLDGRSCPASSSGGFAGCAA